MSGMAATFSGFGNPEALFVLCRSWYAILKQVAGVA
jgi:hypothetical protein